jgi:hypothetical protein
VTTLSQPTVGLLIDIAAERVTRPNLGTLLMRADLTQYRLGASLYTKKGLVLDALAGARAAAEDGDQAAHRGLLTFARLVVSKLVSDPERPSGWFDELREALLADGYQLTWEYVAPDPAAEDAPPVSYKILPTDAGPVPLAGEINALEHELATRGYGDALNHYRQATDAFVQHNYEATNSCLRPALEDLVVRLAGEHAGFVKPTGQGGGGAAIQALRQTGRLDEDDGGVLLRALWGMTHTKGPPPGRSTADETRFRLQVVTATARMLLHRFPPGR